MIGQPPCQRATLRRIPLRNEPVPHCGVTDDGIVGVVAVHSVHVGEEDVVGEIAPDGRVVYRALDGECFQVCAVADAREQEDCWSPDGASREDDFFRGVDVIERG
jgi:hypothetical protein